MSTVTRNTETNSTRELLPHHREHLRSSGLNDETIDAAGLYSVTDEQEARNLLYRDEKTHVPVPAIAFPYDDSYVRLRPDHPRVVREGDAPAAGSHAAEVAEAHGSPTPEPQDEKVIKYEAPTDRYSRIYIPRAVQPAIDDVAVPIYLTEGEKKALAGCQAGLAAVAAPGVYNFGNAYWRKVSQGLGEDVRDLHPDLVRLGVGVGTL